MFGKKAVNPLKFGMKKVNSLTLGQKTGIVIGGAVVAGAVKDMVAAYNVYQQIPNTEINPYQLNSSAPRR